MHTYIIQCSYICYIINTILYQAPESHNSYHFNQHNVTWKWFCLQLISPLKWIYSVSVLKDFTETKLKKFHSSINFVYVFFHWAFCYPNQSPYYLMLQLSKAVIVWSIQDTSSFMRVCENVWNATSWNSKFLSHYSLVHILGNHYCFLPGIFR